MADKKEKKEKKGKKKEVVENGSSGGNAPDKDTVAAFAHYEALVRKRTLAAQAVDPNEDFGVVYEGSLEQLRVGSADHWSKRYVKLVYVKGGKKRELRLYHDKTRSEILDVLTLIPTSGETIDVKSRGEVAWKALFIITVRKTGQSKTEHTFRANKNDVEDWVRTVQCVIDNEGDKIETEIGKNKGRVKEEENGGEKEDKDRSNKSKLLTRITSVKNLMNK
eukprot:TRINITY_DN5405_c0_g1_i1.p1 TRINITY_DN5405_c0_g1~~TRINITY_DN5405_c0_g1_i1.p1  ORF type:complete len:221 (+),score=73.69 TRINITY_DN5405_c0_g1_i1:237-899(+)